MTKIPLIIPVITLVLFAVLTIPFTAHASVSDDFFEEYRNWAYGIFDDYQQIIDNLKAENERLRMQIQYLENSNPTQSQTTIKDTEIQWTIFDSKGNQYDWSMPIDTYESSVIRSNFQSFFQSKTTLYGNVDLKLSSGKTVSMPDMTKFMKYSFGNVIDEVYENSNDKSDFIYEVWFIVSQLTVYSEDVNSQSEGRYPLETLTRTGGDCEDLAILIADMIKSSKYTKNWNVELVYMDMYNPTNPQTVNHMIVYVNDGQYSYYIEATVPPPSTWDYYYPDGVVGWYYEV